MRHVWWIWITGSNSWRRGWRQMLLCGVSVSQKPLTALKSWEEWRKSTESSWWGGTYGPSVHFYKPTCVRKNVQYSIQSPACFIWIYRRPSLERLCQSSLTLTEGGSRSHDNVAAELLSNHETLLQGARSRIRCLQDYQAFEEALKAVETWLRDVEGSLEKLENTEGNKKEVEDKLERAQVRPSGSIWRTIFSVDVLEDSMMTL